MPIINPEEKKVEYLELIYDLIFVYIIGRNNLLLQNPEDGFISGSVFLAYILCSLAAIQIWNYTTFYTNMYGRNSVRDHVFMFINMYLLYYIGEGTRLHWESYQNQYHLAWALILVNIGIQYLIEMRNHRDDPGARKAAKGLMAALFGEAAIVFIAIPVFNLTGFPLSGIAILYGIVVTCLLSGRTKISRIDFTHLSERAMLFVVFTFGEMIIVIAGYFTGGFEPSTVYFSLMGFLIAVGLLLSYEVLYNRIIDREQQTSGMIYMIIHIFLLFGMNSITASLEFMRDPAVSLWPKTLFLIISFLLFFGCMFALLIFAKTTLKRCRKFLIPVVLISVVFVLLMILLREMMHLNILVSVLYVFTIFFLILKFSRRREFQKK